MLRSRERRIPIAKKSAMTCDFKTVALTCFKLEEKGYHSSWVRFLLLISNSSDVDRFSLMMIRHIWQKSLTLLMERPVLTVLFYFKFYNLTCVEERRFILFYIYFLINLFF